MRSPRRSPARGAQLRRRRVRLTAGLALTGVLALSLSACTRDEVVRFGMLEPATREGARILGLWQGSWVAALLVGILVWGLIVWSVIFHRKKTGRLPSQIRANLPVEAIYTIVPLIMVAVLFYFTVRDQNYVTDTSKKPDVTVDVVGYQWSWKFYYENDGVNGRQPEDGVTVVGRSGQRPTLVLPEGKRVQFNLYSNDVNHAFWIPAFLTKRDVIPYKKPGPGQQYWTMPQKDQPYWDNKVQVVPSRTGTFAGRCSELCGVDHDRMLFTVKVVSWSEYQSFIKTQSQSQAGGTGS